MKRRGTDIVAVHHDKVFPGGVDGGGTNGLEASVPRFGKVGGTYGAERVGVDEKVHSSGVSGLVALQDSEGVVVGDVVGDDEDIVRKEATHTLHVAEDTFEVGGTIFDGATDTTTGCYILGHETLAYDSIFIFLVN